MSSTAIHMQLLKLMCSVGCLQVMMPVPSLRRDLHRLWTAITHQVCSLLLFPPLPNLPCTLFHFPVSRALSLSFARSLARSFSLSLERSLARSLVLLLGRVRFLSRESARERVLSLSSNPIA